MQNAINAAHDKHNLQRNAVALNKLVDDFKYLQSITQIGDATCDATCCFQLPDVLHLPIKLAAREFIQSWLTDNLQKLCLCSALQALTTDKELLYFYYSPAAFLQQEAYATALFICLKSLELKQFSLLSQINEDLYSGTVTANAVSFETDLRSVSRHKRSTSHPIFSISPPKRAATTQKTCHGVNNATEVDGSSPKVC